eukprot:COSAG02_NODE_56010_length_287_cov_1.351064_1_plen_46_part_01
MRIIVVAHLRTDGQQEKATCPGRDEAVGAEVRWNGHEKLIRCAVGP